MTTAICTTCKVEKPLTDFTANKKKRNGRSSSCRRCHQSLYPTTARYHVDNRGPLITLCRRRARKAGVPCAISKSDLVIPDRCPVLGIPLSLGRGVCHAGSPTVDRLRPELGYVTGNINIISSKANRIKNNATLEELKALVAWWEGLEP